MKATFLGLTVALGVVSLSGAASALPMAQGLAPDAAIEQAHVVRKKVVVGPRCTTVVKKRIGPFGRKVVTREKRCF